MMVTETQATHAPNERRRDPRDDILYGLCRWLEASRRRSGTTAIAVADEFGCLVAGAGAARSCEELAAHGPLTLDFGSVPLTRAVLGQGAAWLCALASPSLTAEGWSTLKAGCVRILGIDE